MNSLFKNKRFAIEAKPAVVRTERVLDPKKPAPLPSKIASSRAEYTQPSAARVISGKCPSVSARVRPGDCPLEPHPVVHSSKRKATHQRSLTQHIRLESDSSDDENPTEIDSLPPKRQKIERPVDSKRKLRSKEALGTEDEVLEIIHAADIKTVGKSLKSNADIPAVTVELKYPRAFHCERYDLIFGKENIDPTREIIDVAKIVTEVYLTEEQERPFTNPETGIIRRLERAKNLLSKNPFDKDLLDGFKKAVETYNSAIDKFVADGAFAKNLDSIHHLPLEMVRCILRQVYDRAVSPKVELLRKYENGSDNVYGELLPSFVSKILGEAGLNSTHLFVDLGSGVGNVVLQAALEFGCESWGCEMMENACKLAEAQEKEFRARCRLWGITTGNINLESGDFLDNRKIHMAMQRADVILVNNQAFTPSLNQKLKDLFLDLKDGCRIISLKSFVPHGHQISSRNLSDPANLLDVTKGEYHSNSVSWTDAGGSFFVATKNEKRLEAFRD